MRRAIALSLVLFTILFACSRPNATSETTSANAGQPVKGDWAVVRLEAEPETLNPLTSTSAVAHFVLWGANNSQIYELLLGYNPDDQWSVTKPLLAEAPPTISDDHLTYTVKIRDGVRWHDGQPFTPEDVLFTFKAAACPLADTAQLRSDMTDIADIQVDGHSVRFLMSKANVYNYIAVVNSLAIIPKHVFDPEGLLDTFSYKDMIGPKGKTDPKIKKFAEQFNNHPAGRMPVGTGPYKFEKWDSGRDVVLARNDDYWGKKGYLDKIDYRIIVDYTAALAALKSGEIDLQPRLLPIQYNQQTSGQAFEQQFTKTKYEYPAAGWLIWNNERPFFKDKRVRQALTMLIDRQKIIDTIRQGFGRMGASILNPQSKYFDRDLKPLPYDPKRAGELLDAAGWIDHDGDGIRDKDGVKFKFEFLGSMGSTTYKQLFPVLAEEFRKNGIEITDRVIESALLQKTVKEHQFDAFSIVPVSDLDQQQYQVFHSSSAQSGSNWSNFKNAECDKLLEQIRLEFDDAKRKDLYWKLQELIADEQPVTILYYGNEPAAYSKRFQDVRWLPMRPGYDVTSWWVPLSQQKYKGTAAPKG